MKNKLEKNKLEKITLWIKSNKLFIFIVFTIPVFLFLLIVVGGNIRLEKHIKNTILEEKGTVICLDKKTVIKYVFNRNNIKYLYKRDSNGSIIPCL